MSEPVRIQRQRTKGWRMPEGAVYVGRPSRWGNPFVIAAEGRQGSIELFRKLLLRDAHVGWHRGEFVTYPLDAEIRRELAGKDLACWCPLDQPCHADVLLEIANSVGAAS